MAAIEEELYDELAYEDAEGMAEMDDELGMEEFAAEEFEDEFDVDFADEEAFLDDDMMEADAYDVADEYEDVYDEYGFEEDEEYDEEEDALDDAMADALAAEDADEFWGALVGIGKRMLGGIGRGIARLIAKRRARRAQARKKAAGGTANMAQRLRAEGASEDEGLEAFAELAVSNPRLLPVVAGVAARSVLKSKGARMSKPARKQAVKQMKSAAKTLVRKRGPVAIRALPKIAKSVKRNAAAKGTPASAAVKVVRRTAAKVATSPALTRKLARPSPSAKRRVKLVVRRSLVRPRSYVIPGPARITITGA